MQAVLNEALAAPSKTGSRPDAARRAVKMLFFLNGALLATWASRIPAVQAERGLGNGALGLTLLSIAVGAVIAMPLAGFFIARRGSDRVIRFTALSYCALLPALILAPNVALLIAVMFCFGASHGALDVAMNAQAVAIERQHERPIMSSFHAFWSVGGLAGAALGGLLAAQALPPLPHFLVVALLASAALARVLPELLRAPERLGHTAAPEAPASMFPMPSRGLVALGIVALCVMAGEGAMADWSAVYLRNTVGTGESLAAAGYAAFSLAMAAGRFLGDQLTARFGPVMIVRAGGALSAGGLLLALVAGQPGLSLAGFAMVGLGYAVLVPIVFSAAGNVTGMAPGVALASVSTVGYLGFLIGPPLIGFAAELLGLRGALGIIVLTSLLAMVLAPAVGGPKRSGRLVEVAG